MMDVTICRVGRWRLRLLWLPGAKRFGPWPLWSWGVRTGYAFDLGYLRVALWHPRVPSVPDPSERS